MFTKIKILTVLHCILFSSIVMAERIDTIKEKGEIALCAHPDQMPFSKRADKPEGFQVDIAKAIAEKLDVSLNVSWIFSKRQAKKTGCDFYTGVARLDDSDSKYLLITDAYLHLEFKLVTLNETKSIENINDLKSMVVGVSSGSLASRSLIKNNVGIAVRFSDEESRLQALADGLIDAAIVTNISSGWFEKKYGHHLKVIDAEKILNEQLNYDYAIGLRKSDNNTRDTFNKILSQMKDDGTLLKIFNKYGLKPA